jgi:hypothetical protein
MEEKVDIHDEQALKEAGIYRAPSYYGRNRTFWTKSPEEREVLCKVKYKQKDGHFHTVPQRQNSVYAKLIVQLSNNDIFPKSTYSIMCYDGNVPGILNRFVQGNRSLVKNYSFNGIRYFV